MISGDPNYAKEAEYRANNIDYLKLVTTICGEEDSSDFIQSGIELVDYLN